MTDKCRLTSPLDTQPVLRRTQPVGSWTDHCSGNKNQKRQPGRYRSSRKRNAVCYTHLHMIFPGFYFLNLMRSQPVKKFFVLFKFHDRLQCNLVLFFLSLDRSVQPTPFRYIYFKICLKVILPSTAMFSKCILSFIFPYQNSVSFSILSNKPAGIMNHLVRHCWFYFLPLRSQQHNQHPVL